MKILNNRVGIEPMSIVFICSHCANGLNYLYSTFSILIILLYLYILIYRVSYFYMNKWVGIYGYLSRDNKRALCVIFFSEILSILRVLYQLQFFFNITDVKDSLWWWMFVSLLSKNYWTGLDDTLPTRK